MEENLGEGKKANIKMDKENLINEYINEMKSKEYSRMTVRNVYYLLKSFMNDYNLPDKESITDYLFNADVSKNTKITRSYILLAFAEFLKERTGAKFKIGIPKLKKSKKLPVYLTKAEIGRLLNTARGNIRDFTIIAFIIQTGVRVNELINLKMKDVDLQDGTIRVKGKGDKERIIPLSKDMVKILSRYLQGRKEGYLFEIKGRKISVSTIQKMVKKYAEEAHLKKSVSPHKLRHTFATLALEAGVNPFTLKDLLGHSSLNTTLIYTHITPEVSRDAVKRIAEITKNVFEEKQK